MLFLEHKKLNTYTKNQLYISINFGEKPYQKMAIKMAIAIKVNFHTLIFSWFVQNLSKAKQTSISAFSYLVRSF